MLRLAADENFDGRIARGLQRRLPDIDLVRVQDTPLAGADDDAVLDWAARENRLVLTHDVARRPPLLGVDQLGGDAEDGRRRRAMNVLAAAEGLDQRLLAGDVRVARRGWRIVGVTGRGTAAGLPPAGHPPPRAQSRAG